MVALTPHPDPPPQGASHYGYLVRGRGGTMLPSQSLHVFVREGVTVKAYTPLGGPAGALPDRRLRHRLDFLVATFADQPQRSIPQVTGNRNDMDAAYAFFDNQRVCPEGIVSSCLPQTLQRLQGCPRVLAIQDTSDLNYSSLDDTVGLG